MPSDSSAAESASQADAGGGAHAILVAASEEKTLEFLEQVAEHTGSRIASARDGAQALDMARSGEFDLAVLDLRLDRIDGVDLCAKVRDLAGPKPLVLLTGVSDATLRRAYASAADDFLVLPYLASVAYRRIDALLMRRMMERELRLLRRAFDSAGEGLTLLDARSAEYPTVFVNREFARMTGYSKHELLGHNLRMLAGPDTDVTELAKLRDALTQGRRERVLLKNYRKDGSAFWNELAMAPLRDDTGRLTHWIGIQTDASHRIRAVELDEARQDAEERVEKRTQELIEALNDMESRRRFSEMILNALSVGVITTDATGKVSFANSHALDILARSLPDVLQRPLVTCLGADEAARDAIEATPPGNSIDVELDGRTGRLPVTVSLMVRPEEFANHFGHVLMFWRRADSPRGNFGYRPDDELGTD